MAPCAVSGQRIIKSRISYWGEGWADRESMTKRPGERNPDVAIVQKLST